MRAYPPTEIGPPMSLRTLCRERVSDHSMTGPAGASSGPTGTVEAHCPVMPIAYSSSRDTSSVTRAMADRRATSIRWRPGWRCRRDPRTPRRVEGGGRIWPSTSTAATFGPPLPRSMAGIQLTGATSCMASRTPDISMLIVWLPCGVAEAVHRAAGSGRSHVVQRVVDGALQVVEEGLRDPGPGVGAGHAEVQRCRQLQSVHAPTGLLQRR